MQQAHGSMSDAACVHTGYANGLVNAIAAVITGWATDRYELRRTWVISAGCLLLGGMMILEARHRNAMSEACVSAS